MRRAKGQGQSGVLVPLIEKFFNEQAIAIESAEYIAFLTGQMGLMVAREHRRKEDPGHYSPTSLGEKCVRKAYLNRHSKINHNSKSPYDAAAHGFFLTGNFMHLRWQFVFYKMEKWIANS